MGIGAERRPTTQRQARKVAKTKGIANAPHSGFIVVDLNLYTRCWRNALICHVELPSMRAHSGNEGCLAEAFPGISVPLFSTFASRSSNPLPTNRLHIHSFHHNVKVRYAGRRFKTQRIEKNGAKQNSTFSGPTATRNSPFTLPRT